MLKLGKNFCGCPFCSRGTGALGGYGMEDTGQPVPRSSSMQRKSGDVCSSLLHQQLQQSCSFWLRFASSPHILIFISFSVLFLALFSYPVSPSLSRGNGCNQNSPSHPPPPRIVECYKKLIVLYCVWFC